MLTTPAALADASVVEEPVPMSPKNADAEASASSVVTDEEPTSVTNPLEPHWQSVDAAPDPILETTAAH